MCVFVLAVIPPTPDLKAAFWRGTEGVLCQVFLMSESHIFLAPASICDLADDNVLICELCASCGCLK